MPAVCLLLSPNQPRRPSGRKHFASFSLLICHLAFLIKSWADLNDALQHAEGVTHVTYILHLRCVCSTSAHFFWQPLKQIRAATQHAEEACVTHVGSHATPQLRRFIDFFSTRCAQISAKIDE